MVRSNTRRAHSHPAAGHAAARRAAAGPSHADPLWLGDRQHAAGLLGSVLGSAAGYALFATDLDGTIRLWSRGAADLYGYQSAAVLGRLSWWDMCADSRAAAQRDRTPLETALREGSWTGTVTRTGQTGDRVTVQAVLTVLHQEPGQPAVAACDFTGHSRHRLLGRRFATLFEDADAAQAGISRALRDGRVEFLELTLAPVGRPPVVVGFHAGRLRDPRNDQDALIVAVRDLTPQKATEQELHLYAQSLYGATTDALLLTDLVGVITDVNHSMEELTGRARGDLIGRPAESCFTERGRAHDFIATVLREGKVADVELTVRRPDGGSTVLWYSAATFRDRQGKLQGIFASARDITERKKFEDLQARMLERATDLDRAKSDFVSRVSHELRSPLTSVLGYLELIRDGRPGPLTADQKRMLEAMSRNGQRLLALIEDLLLLSRIEAGPVPVRYQEVELGPLLQAVHGSFDRAIRSGELTTRLGLAPGVVIEGDPAQLERLAANLVSNAVKFTPPGGEIKISCRRAGDEAIIQVGDTGIGVPEAEQPQLFSRFFRSSISMEQETQGTGLGLFIVRHVAQAHGGQVTVVSAVGAGSTFTVRLPVHRPARPARPGR